MKKMRLFPVLSLMILCSHAVAAGGYGQGTPNTVVVYFFWGNGCPYCAAMMPFIDNMTVKYPNLHVNKREVWYNATNSRLLSEMAVAYGQTASGIPVTFLSDIMYTGVSTSQNTQIENRIIYCSNHTCPSPDEILAAYRGENATTTTTSTTTMTISSSTSSSTITTSTTTTTTSTSSSTTTTLLYGGSAAVSIYPAVISRGVGQTFSIAIPATSLSGVQGYSFRVSFDPTKLAVESISGGNYLSACPDPYSITIMVNKSGSVGIDRACLGENVNSGTSLGIIVFRTLSAGSVNLNLSGTSIDFHGYTKAVVTEKGAVVTISTLVSVGDAYANLNREFNVQVTASTVPNVLGYSFNLTYDPTKLTLTHISAGNYFYNCASPMVLYKNNSGVVGIDAVCLGQTVNSGTTLANITFRALATGNSTLALREAIISSGNGTNLPVITDDGFVQIILKQGDANGDNSINYYDMLILAPSYGKTQSQAGFDIRADFNGDGKVDYADLLILASNYGK